MTVETTTVWRCDRCKNQSPSDLGPRPSGWVSFAAYQMGATYQTPELAMDLCPDCKFALRKWLEG